MAETEPRGIGVEMKPHAYDPVRNPELFEGVLPRRVVAFLIDVFVIMTPVAAAVVFIILLGLVTFGLGWVFLPLLYPATVIWALLYYGFTFGSPASATLGMRANADRDAHLVWRAVLFRAGRGACSRILCFDHSPDASRPAGLLLQ